MLFNKPKYPNMECLMQALFLKAYSNVNCKINICCAYLFDSQLKQKYTVNNVTKARYYFILKKIGWH